MRWFLGLDDTAVVDIHGMLVVSVLVLCCLVFLCLVVLGYLVVCVIAVRVLGSFRLFSMVGAVDFWFWWFMG